MRTIKPQRLGLLTRVFENDGRCYLVVSAIAFFPFDEPQRLLPEVAMWKLVAEEMGAEAILDEGMSKLRGELLLSAHAFPGRPAPACRVRVELGPIDKTLYVVGDRRWEGDVPSSPQPFERLPIDHAHAFGGPGYELNPLGCGFDEEAEGPLPNVEDPKALLQRRGQRPRPVGFEGYPLTWPQRFSKVGTYDRTWLKERSPGFAVDFDWSFFNVAPDDQQIDGYFVGDERFALENLHPDEARLESRLPGVRARAFVSLPSGGALSVRELSMRLDTVRLFPHVKRGLAIFRGAVEVAEDDAADVAELLIAAEDLAAPRPQSHYLAVIAERRDSEKRALAALRDHELMPVRSEAPPNSLADMPGEPHEPEPAEGRLRHNLKQKMLRMREEQQQRLAELDFDWTKHGGVPTLPELEEPEPAPSLDELPEYIEKQKKKAEDRQVEARRKAAEAEENARKECEKQGLDYDEVVAKARKEAAGPPKFSAEAKLDELRELVTLLRNAGHDPSAFERVLGDAAFVDKLRQTEEALRDAYRRGAQEFPAAAPLEGEAAQQARQAVIDRRARGESLAGADLTGADLSMLDLQGVDLRGAFLEAAQLRRADLRGAQLQGAVLVRADLTEARLQGADLSDANLSQAILIDAQASKTQLEGAQLVGAQVAGASFREARMLRTDWRNATFDNTDFSRAQAELVIFQSCDLRGLLLYGATFEKGVFIDADVRGVDCSGARFRGACFLGSRAEGASFRDAVLDNLRVVSESRFDRADFQGASLIEANLRGTSLVGANLSRATLTSADLSECDLGGANLQRIRARGSRFVRAKLDGADLREADLMEAVLQKARIARTDFSGANLFRADFARARGDDKTRFQGADTRFVRLVKGTANVPG